MGLQARPSSVMPVYAFAKAALLLSGGSAVEVDVNLPLVLVQLGVVAGLTFFLKPVLFDPLLALFEERERRVEGARKEAREMDDQAAELLLKYESELKEVHQKAGAERDKVRVAAQAVEAREMAEARKEAQSILEAGRSTMETQRAEVEQKLRAGEGELAKQIASRVLGREVA